MRIGRFNIDRRAAAAVGLAAAAGAAVAIAVGSDDPEPARQARPPATTEETRERTERPRERKRRREPERRERRKRRPLEVALQDDAVFLERAYYDRELALRQATELGVSRIRVHVLWSTVLGPDAKRQSRPAQPSYRWGRYDSLAEAAGRHGIRLQLALTGPAPAWASGNGKVGPVRPDPAAFGQFAAAAASHFRGRVDRYSIWNEPNFFSWLAPLDSSPSLYRGLYESAYAAIKRADPRAKVLISETAPYAQDGRALAPLAFLRALTCRTEDYRPARRCKRLVADGYAHHPYDFERPPESPRPGRDNATLGSLDNLTAALDRLDRARALTTPRGGPLPLYLTEYGYFAKGKREVPDATRAAYLTRAFEIARRERRVRQMLQYLLVAPPVDFPSAFFDTSIVTNAGQPLPPYLALAEWSRKARKRGRVAGPG